MIEFVLFLTTAIVDLLRAALSFAAALVFSVFYTLPSGSYVVMGEISPQQEEYVVTAPASTTVSEVLITTGAPVDAGQTAIRFDDNGAHRRTVILEAEISALESEIAKILAALRHAGDLGELLPEPFTSSDDTKEDACVERYAERLAPDGGPYRPPASVAEAAPPGAPDIPPLPETQTPAPKTQNAHEASQEDEINCETPATLEPFVFASEPKAVSFFRDALDNAGSEYSNADKRLITSKASLLTKQAFALREQADKKKGELNLLDNEIQALERFKSEGLLSDIQIDPLKVERDAILLDISRIAAEYSTLNSQMIDMQLRLVNREKSENMSSLTERLDALILRRRNLLEDLSEAKDAASESAVASPISGTVSKISADLSGRGVNIGEVLFTVAPAKTNISFRGEHIFGLNATNNIGNFCITGIESIETDAELSTSRPLTENNLIYDTQSILPIQNAQIQIGLTDQDLNKLGVSETLGRALPARLVLKQCGQN